jgi:para-aminobenzoate synthetase component 1
MMAYPLIEEISYQDPCSIFAYFCERDGAVFLDSSELRKHCGRYSFIAVDPFSLLTSKHGKITLNGEIFHGNPFQILAEKLDEFHRESHPDLPPFQGGAAGFFSYDLYRHLENVSEHALDDMHYPDMTVGFYDIVLAFDHELREAWIFSNGYPEKEEPARRNRAERRLAWMLRELSAIKAMPDLNNQPSIIEADFSRNQYQLAVQKVIDYILAGDIFEANISQRFKATLPNNFSSFDLYSRLRKMNPAPFAAYLKFDDLVIASASPERFLKLTQDKVETRPIKGTRPRGKSEEEDRALANDLLQSAKDHAENVMIVDLLRNDLSKVCENHSVKVPQLCGLESYASVHHLVSVVEGKLKKHYKAMDLFTACFPGGSITGAPKIRAMEIIAEIEPTSRGPYCGSIGYIGFDGTMDTSIVIRTCVIKNNIATFQAGGAIVADSNPEEEYEETLTKAKALHKVLGYV